MRASAAHERRERYLAYQAIQSGFADRQNLGDASIMGGIVLVPAMVSFRRPCVVPFVVSLNSLSTFDFDSEFKETTNVERLNYASRRITWFAKMEAEVRQKSLSPLQLFHMVRINPHWRHDLRIMFHRALIPFIPCFLVGTVLAIIASPPRFTLFDTLGLIGLSLLLGGAVTAGVGVLVMLSGYVLIPFATRNGSAIYLHAYGAFLCVLAGMCWLVAMPIGQICLTAAEHGFY